jgi:hypothetical protein
MLCHLDCFGRPVCVISVANDENEWSLLTLSPGRATIVCQGSGSCSRIVRRVAPAVVLYKQVCVEQVARGEINCKHSFVFLFPPSPHPYFFYLVCEAIGTAATPGLG